tara:strand:- start:10 stop:930 length:921 start_codon:yes stop_codon:yes gene_type:complete
MAKNIGPGDAVFTTNFSYFATTEVISLVGATPVFVDINRRNFNINPELLESEINKVLKDGKLIPRVIIAVDLFGQLADYDKIKQIARKYNLFLIEDAAQSFGATYNNKRSCSFGDVSSTSFFPAKPFGCYGDGGAIFTNDSNIAELCRSIRVHGQGKDKYDNVRVGLNSRLDTLQANVLLNKLDIFNDELISRNEIADYYSDKLSKYLVTPFIENGNVSAWAQYSLLLKNESERDSLVKSLKEKGIPLAIYYKKIFSELDIYKNIIDNTFPVSKKISQTIFSIPMHPYLTYDELDTITDAVIKFYK